MKMQVEHIDLRCPERYRLIIEANPEQFSLLIFSPADDSDYFFYQLPKKNSVGGFAQFSDFFFDNDFFTLPFDQIQILNHTPVFTFVPDIIFNEKDKNEYMEFLFVENTGKLLCHSLQKAEIIFLHAISEEMYRFFQRSFGTIQIVHYMAPLIAYFYDKGDFVDGNRMIISRKADGIDILCFSRDRLLMCNHFNSSRLNESLYYALFVWRQLKFSQSKDFVYIAEESPDLSNLLKEYIRRVNLLDFTSGLPLEMALLSRCEI